MLCLPRGMFSILKAPSISDVVPNNGSVFSTIIVAPGRVVWVSLSITVPRMVCLYSEFCPKAEIANNKMSSKRSLFFFIFVKLTFIITFRQNSIKMIDWQSYFRWRNKNEEWNGYEILKKIDIHLIISYSFFYYELGKAC